LQEAYDLGAKVLEVQTRTLGDKHPNTMMSMASQATTLWQDGHFDDVAMLFWDVVNLNLEVYGRKDPLTLVNTHNLAVCLRAQGDYNGAMTVMEEVLRLRVEILGVGHADTENSAQLIDLWQCSGRPDLNKVLPLKVEPDLSCADREL
jgi:hypothetical protein